MVGRSWSGPGPGVGVRSLGDYRAEVGGLRRGWSVGRGGDSHRWPGWSRGSPTMRVVGGRRGRGWQWLVVGGGGGVLGFGARRWSAREVWGSRSNGGGRALGRPGSWVVVTGKWGAVVSGRMWPVVVDSGWSGVCEGSGPGGRWSRSASGVGVLAFSSGVGRSASGSGVSLGAVVGAVGSWWSGGRRAAVWVWWVVAGLGSSGVVGGEVGGRVGGWRICRGSGFRGVPEFGSRGMWGGGSVSGTLS